MYACLNRKAKDEDCENTSKRVRTNSKKSEKEDNKGTRSHKNACKGVRPNSKESLRERSIRAKSHKQSTKKVRPISKESEKENSKKIRNHQNSCKGVWLNSKESKNKDHKRNGMYNKSPHDKETSNSFRPHTKKPPNKGYRIKIYKANWPNSATRSFLSRQ